MKKEKVLKTVEILANKLGTTAEKLFGYYVKNAKLYALYYWLELGASVLSFLVGLYLSDLTYSFVFDGSWTILQMFGFIIGCGLTLVGIICIVVLLYSVNNLINAVKNPEYEALHELISDLSDL